ncbi:MAG: hypothetical protein O3B86_09410, partial [Planctomycetota bacterium]|nr:hypothetical protein [Planctomycetota bacterium]
ACQCFLHGGLSKPGQCQPAFKTARFCRRKGGHALPAEFRTQRSKTDDQGVYSLPTIYPGEYTILFEQAGELPDDPGMAPAELPVTDTSLSKYKGDNAPSASVSGTNTEFNFLLDSLP